MGRLSVRDEQRATDLIRDAYAPRDFEGFISFLLTALPKLIDSEVTSYNEMRPRRHRSRNWVNPSSLMVSERHEAWTRVMHEHPVVKHFQDTGCQTAILRISDFFSARQLRNKALYSEHYLPLGQLLDCLPILWSEKGVINAIGVHRHRQFSDDEKHLMEFLRPHLIRAHANSLISSKLIQRAASLERAMNTSSLAVITIRSDRTIDFATALARRWMRTYFSSSLTNERLPEVLDLWLQQHKSELREVLRLQPPTSTLVINHDERRLVVTLLPNGAETVMIFEEQEQNIQPASLGSLNLTEREREVLAWLASGKSRSDLCRELGISSRTIEAHLRNINEALGVSNVTAAVAHAFRASRVGEPTPSATEREEIEKRARAKLVVRNTARPVE